MKTILIIYPHWMPSNLVGAQRARLLCNYLGELGWKPIVLAANPKFYLEPLVPELLKLVKPEVDVRFVDVRDKRGIYRYIGDLTLRGYNKIKAEAIRIIQNEDVDFVWLPIPSYYNALLGRPIHKVTGVPFGIDYIDPWVNGFPNQEVWFSKAWISNQLAKILEPYSVKTASLISGVAYNYYEPVLIRNFKNKPIIHCSMQYGFDLYDYSVIPDPFNIPWDSSKTKPIIYAGAFLPKSHLFIKILFQAIAELRNKGELDSTISFFFLGTGTYQGKGILDYADEAGISDIVSEKRERLSYLQILYLLREAYGILVIGSIEKHYSASKIFQALLSETPVFTIFHQQSEAIGILKEAQADNYTIKYLEGEEDTIIRFELITTFKEFANQSKKWKPDLKSLEKYSSRASARILIDAIEKVLNV